MKSGLPEEWLHQTEIVIVGAGAAGLATAIAAHDAGADALIIERMSEPSGDLAIAGGNMYAANTSVHRAMGYQDSADGMYKVFMAVTPEATPEEAEQLRIVADSSAGIVDWLTGLGLKYPAQTGVPGLIYGGLEHLPHVAAQVTPVPRTHTPEGGGKALRQVLLNAVSERAVPILTDTRARELVQDDKGEVVGVRAEKNGKSLFIRARKGVVLCSGHFGWNQRLKKLYLPQYMHLPNVTAPGLEGDGVLMAQALGAALEHVSHLRPNMGVRYEPGRATLWAGRAFPFIFVNKQGKRFVDDYAKYGPLAQALAAQEEQCCFCIFDQTGYHMRQATFDGVNGIWPDLIGKQNRVLRKATTVSALAREIGIDPAALETTIATYNENAKAGIDPDFGRTMLLDQLAERPFYALKVEFVHAAPSGGLKTNGEARVLDVFGRIIPRLYAVGTISALYSAYPGSGAAFTKAFAFARIAATNAARETLN